MTRKKNLLIVTPTKVGLTETFIRAHIEQLDAQVFYLYGWELDFKTADAISLQELYTPKPKVWDKLKSLLPHFLFFRLEQQRLQQFTKDALIKRYLKEHQIEVVLAEYGTAGSFIAPVCEAVKIPLIVHFHGFDASKHNTLASFKEGYQRMFNYASYVIAVSQSMKKALIKLGCEASKIVVTVCAPHSDYLHIDGDVNSDYLIAIGRHTYKKAPYLTILAFQEVLKQQPQLKLKMIGDGELFDVSKNLIKSLGLESKILLLGGLERPEIIRHLKTAFLFVQHSLVAHNGDSEGTPVGVMEAMAAGLPVVSTRHAGIPDVVEENVTGFLVDENDIDQMAQYMLQIAENRSLAKSMGQKGKEKIRSHYTMETHLATLNQLIYAS